MSSQIIQGIQYNYKCNIKNFSAMDFDIKNYFAVLIFGYKECDRHSQG